MMYHNDRSAQVVLEEAACAIALPAMGVLTWRVEHRRAQWIYNCKARPVW